MINFIIRCIYFCILLAAGLYSIHFFSYSFFLPVIVTSKVSLILKKGDNARSVAKKCRKQGLIRAPLAFVLYSFYFRKDDKIKPGKYRFTAGKLWLSEIFKQILKGEKTSGIKVTLNPGSTLKDISKKLFAAKIINNPHAFLEKAKNYPVKDFITCLNKQKINCEGFLYPDTYEFYPSSSPGQVIEKILNRFKNICGPILNSYTKKEDLEFIIKLASIIEMESGFSAEKSRIAGVFSNRLKRGMPLQSDATIQYVFEKRKDRIYYKDLQLESPYNSYKNTGLPPTPICSPRIKSIKAAKNPEKHNYLYFVSNAKGSHIFSRSLKEHNRHKRRYLKARGWK
ncbi:endolytic transglycosylase MltG [Candidatus Riflebacteria bacterium]